MVGKMLCVKSRKWIVLALSRDLGATELNYRGSIFICFVLFFKKTRLSKAIQIP